MVMATVTVSVIIVDDASPDWNDEWYRVGPGRIFVYRFETHGGLTRSWNAGLLWSLNQTPAPIYVVAGNSDVLVGPGGESGDNQGVLLSWDRTMSEIDDRLWFAVDYMGGENVNGGLSFGVAWAFTEKISMIVGYDVWNKKSVAGANTVTTQLDVNF